MTRKRKATPAKKHKGGLLTGMRQGVKSMAGSSAEKEEAAAPTKAAKTKNLIMNILTAAAVLAAGGIMLHRCGVLKF